MTRREIAVVTGALVLALGLSAVLFVGTMASEPASASAIAPRPRIFFDLRNTPPPATRSIADIQERVGPFAAIVPLQRNMTDSARDAAGFLLILIVTATTLLVAHERVVSAYRASLGGWRTQLRVLLTGFAVLGLGLSATALAWVVFLGYVATTARGAPFGVPAALQIGMAAFGVIVVFLIAVLAIGFAATSWRLGDALRRDAPLYPLADPRARRARARAGHRVRARSRRDGAAHQPNGRDHRMNLGTLTATWPGRIVALVVAATVIGGATMVIRGNGAAPKVDLRTTTVTRGSVTQTVSVSGSVNAFGQARLSFKTGGKLDKVYVVVGQPVTAGQPLAKLDTTDLETALATAQQNLASAQANYQKQVLSAADTQQSLADAQRSGATNVANAQTSLSKLRTNYATAKTNFGTYSVGATLLYILWQIPALGALALALVIAYALGAVVTARLISPTGGTTA